MHPRNYYGSFFYREERKETLEELKVKADSIKSDIQILKEMNFSADTEQICVFEMNKKLIEIKNKMHKLINEM